ncbi:hypothetical protein VTJ04DRAFT_5805 [Mycothermus thermophilus]|uniref:uncharacterized protein n=1 Tax=Humicola insolens TaxID=85995 RepID=UPI0037448FD4
MAPITGAYLPALDANAIFLGDQPADANVRRGEPSKQDREYQRREHQGPSQQQNHQLSTPTTLHNHAISILTGQSQSQPRSHDWQKQQQPRPPVFVFPQSAFCPGPASTKVAQEQALLAEAANDFAAWRRSEKIKRGWGRIGLDVMLLVVAVGFVVWKVGGALIPPRQEEE